MVESYDELTGEPTDFPPLQTSPAGSRPRDIATNGNRAARFKPEEGHGRFVAKNLSQVFDSYDLTRRGEDRKIPRQARPTILRKESEKKKLESGKTENETNGNEFRDRSQTAPVLLRRTREKMIEQQDNNNTEDSQDEVVGLIEMPKQHSETKKPQKHRFPFKKNREKENGTKDEVSVSKSRARRARADGQITPNKGEYTSQSDGGTLRGMRERSSSAVSSSTERRRRTRRRRGNRKSGSNTGLDAELDQMSLEEALSALQGGDNREGQTWHENLGDENLQCQVINGTTYFTPVNQNKTKVESDTCGPMSLPSGTTFGDYDEDYRSYGSPNSGRPPTANGYTESSTSGMYALNVEEFKPRRQISQSEPMGSRSVKNDREPTFSSEKMKAQLKEIWVQAEQKKYLTPERFDNTRHGADREVESMTALMAEEMTKTILNETESKINENKISKLWETNNDKSIAQQPSDIWEPEKSTRMSPDNDIWSPAPNDDIMAQMSSITLSTSERHLGLPLDTASTSTSSGDIWRHDMSSRGLITN